jgi:uncharacterized protein (UPF0332 family)
MGIEAGELTGIRNKINIQVYILTDFWDSLKEANPIIFTLLRDGVPFYDRGVFMPWKLLLRMGKIKPSPEAIDMFMSSGEQMLERVGFKLKDIGMEDTYYAILTPSQAALMMFGIAPPTPKETPEVMRDVFVVKEKLLEPNYIDILQRNITIRKDIEHGTKKELTGKEVDELLEDARKYLKRIKKLFGQIELIKEEQDMAHVSDSVVTIVRDVLKAEGVEKVADNELVKTFDEEIVSKGKVAAKFSRILADVIRAKKSYDEKKLSKIEADKIKKDARELIKTLVEHVQRKRGREVEKAKIRVKYGEKYGEIILLGDTAFLIMDLDAETKEIQKAKLNPNGALGALEKSSYEEMEQALAKTEIVPKAFIKEPIFEQLKVIFGRDVEILINY